MPDTPKIEPALSDSEWARGQRLYADNMLESWASESEYVKVIALANAALPDDDPRRITWEMVDDIRTAASLLRPELGTDDDDAAKVDAVADALASFLPPRTP